MTLIAVALAVAGIFVWLVVTAVRRGGLKRPDRQLARMVGRDAAERLIKWELLRDDTLTRMQAAQRALERAEYDRGR